MNNRNISNIQINQNNTQNNINNDINNVKVSPPTVQQMLYSVPQGGTFQPDTK